MDWLPPCDYVQTNTIHPLWKGTLLHVGTFSVQRHDCCCHINCTLEYIHWVNHSNASSLRVKCVLVLTVHNETFLTNVAEHPWDQDGVNKCMWIESEYYLVTYSKDHRIWSAVWLNIRWGWGSNLFCRHTTVWCIYIVYEPMVEWKWTMHSLVPRPSHCPVFDHLQYTKTKGKAWSILWGEWCFVYLDRGSGERVQDWKNTFWDPSLNLST